MVFFLLQWFNATAYLPDDKIGTTLEKLKSEYLPQVKQICFGNPNFLALQKSACTFQWLKKVYKSHGDVFVACMLPNPPDYAKVGGHWDVVLSRYYFLRFKKVGALYHNLR